MPDQPYTGDPVFQPYINSFVSDARAHEVTVDTSTLAIYWHNFGWSRAVADCDMAGTIRMGIKYWNSADDIERLLVLYHEMGHCVLGRYHDTALLPNGQPASIMNPYNIDEAVFLADRDYYLTELFSPSIAAFVSPQVSARQVQYR